MLSTCWYRTTGSSPLCPFSRKVRLLMGEKGEGCELVRESPWEQRDEFVDMNPTGSTPVLPDKWPSQLKPGGRLFAVVGDPPAMSARLIRWSAPGAMVTEELFETVIAPLHNAAQPLRFVF